MNSKVNHFSLFMIFFKIGIFTFGGGYAMIPLIEREIIKNKWINAGEMTDLVAISQSIPGAIAVNISLFVGYRISKSKGAVAAVLGCITPSILIIILVASIFSRFQENQIVQNAFTGVLCAVIALIVMAGYKMAKLAIMDIPTLLISVGTILGLIFLPQINAVFYIIMGAAVGILFYYFFPKKVRQLHEKFGANKRLEEDAQVD